MYLWIEGVIVGVVRNRKGGSWCMYGWVEKVVVET